MTSRWRLWRLRLHWLLFNWIICVSARSVDQYHGLGVNEKILQTIEDYIDVTQDPCDDYFNFACGKWSKKHKSGRYSESTGLVDHKINKRLVNVLESHNYGARDGGNAIIDMVGTYYKSCRHERKNRLVRYLKMIRPDNGINWPLLQQNNESWQFQKGKFHWLRTVAHLRRYGLNNALIEHFVLQNESDSTQYVIELDSPNIDGDDADQFPFALLDIFDNLDLGSLATRIWVQRLKTFERSLQKLRGIQDEYGTVTLTVQDMQDGFPDYPWKEYFQIILEDEISTDYAIQIRNVMYFNELSELLSTVDPELICNYLMIRFLLHLALDRSASADKIDCMVDVRSKMDLAINFIYAERFYKPNALIYNADVRQIINVIRNDFRSKLDENLMNLGYDELQFLKEKLSKIRVNMGNLPNDIDYEFILQYYDNIRLNRNNYYKNHLSLLELRFQKEHELLSSGQPEPDKFFFIADSDTARSSTPFYLFHQNLVVVPYGFLQTPIYHHNMHDVLKYSLLGFNLAHEIAHGFDASGVLYDHHGTVNDIGEIIAVSDKFIEGVACMERNETANLDERIADIVGLRLAYDSFFKGKRNFENQNLTLYGKSMKEIFFLNYAQFFCGNMALEFLNHDSDNVRLRETLSNFEAFAETYNCDVDAKMNPREKCRLW